MLQNAVTVNVSMGLRFGAQVLIALAAVLLLSWSLTLVMLSVLPAIVIAGVLYARFIKRIAKRYQALLAEASAVAQEALGAVRTVRSFAQEGRESGRYSAAVQASYVQGAKRGLGCASADTHSRTPSSAPLLQPSQLPPPSPPSSPPLPAPT